jgi:hypothetical protein
LCSEAACQRCTQAIRERVAGKLLMLDRGLEPLLGDLAIRCFARALAFSML